MFLGSSAECTEYESRVRILRKKAVAFLITRMTSWLDFYRARFSSL